MIGAVAGKEREMPTFSRTTDVDRPIAEVWDVWSDVGILPQLSSSTTEILDAPDRLTEVGQTFRQIVRTVGRCFESTWTVVSVADQDHLTIEGSLGTGMGARYRITELVTELEPGRTRLTLTVDYKLPFGPFGRLASKLGIEKLAQRESGEVLAKLKALLEEQPASTTPGA